ncbi:MAG: type II toxin-antitoxin system VapC family toxin [Tessaracoccus sp.]
MTGYLLDTHVVLWLATAPHMVPQEVRKALVGTDRLCVSAVSAYEVSQKVRLGRLPTAEGLLPRWQELLDEMMAEDLLLRTEDMLRAGSLAWDHRDPFDRMLVAQAQLHGLSLATKDFAIQDYSGVRCLPSI